MIKNPKLKKELENLKEQLEDLKLDFNNYKIKSVTYANKREKIIQQGIKLIGKDNNINLKISLIDSNGEYNIKAIHPEKPNEDICGKFGNFANIISPFGPRCGIQPTKHLSPENGWCRLNHFQAESCLINYI